MSNIAECILVFKYATIHEGTAHDVSNGNTPIRNDTANNNENNNNNDNYN